MAGKGFLIGSGEAPRFDQRNTMFSRPRDKEKTSADILELGEIFFSHARSLRSLEHTEDADFELKFYTTLGLT